MARERMITRTVTTNIIESLYFDLEKMDTVIDKFVVTGEELDTTKAQELLNKSKFEGSRKFLKVIKVDHDTQLYGMPETEFIRLAKKITKSESVQ